jgi:DNA-binding response OmpR family regulator
MGRTRPPKVPAKPRHLVSARTLQSATSHIYRVLIADSDKLALASYREWLTSQGFAVSTAHTPLKCLAAFREQRPNVLVLEAEMSLGREDDFVALQKGGAELFQLPLIVLCNRPDPNACAALASAFPLSERYQKPLTAILLCERIRHLLHIAHQETAPANWQAASSNGLKL